MMSLLGLGALATGVGALGSAVGGYSSGKKSRKLAEKQFAQQMDESIQRRVADAKAAGVHPLFALGASVGASPTMHAGGSATGSALGEGLAEAGRAATGYARAKQGQPLQAAQINAANASATRDEAEAQLALSRAKVVEQQLGSRGHDGMGAKTFPYPQGNTPDAVYGPAELFNPRIPTSKVKGVSSGTAPAESDYVFDDGRKIRTYGDSLQADEIKQLDILYQRAIHKGTDALVGIENFFKRKGIPYKWMR